MYEPSQTVWPSAAQLSSALGALPPGGFLEFGTNGLTGYASANAMLLPYFEETSLHDVYDFDRPWKDQTATVSSLAIPLFNCPSSSEDNPFEHPLLGSIVTHSIYGTTDYVYSKGISDAWCFQNSADAFLEPGPIPKQLVGAFYLNRALPLRKVSDGTSKTIAMGEGAGGEAWPVCHGAGCTTPELDADGKPQEAATGWLIAEPNSTPFFSMGLVGPSAFACTIEPLNKRPVTDTMIAIADILDPACQSSADGGNHSTSNFRSDHPGGGNFLYADGSVHFVNEGVDMAAYRAASTIQGGEVGTVD